MSQAQDVVQALYAWSLRHAVLIDTAVGDALQANGDPDLVPFHNEHAAFFKTRKVVKISVRRRAQTGVITLATRLPVARSKREVLIRLFAERYADLGLELDIVVMRPFKIDQQIQGTYNPVYWHRDAIACGSSLGLGNQRNAGTLCALALNANDKLVGISCNHVTGGCNTASVGTPIVVPGIQDVSPDHHEIAVIGLHDSTGAMSQGLPQVFDISNNSDIAFFAITEPDLMTSMQGFGDKAYDTPTSFGRITEGLRVKKWGRSSELTYGEITRIVTEPESVEYNVVSYYGPTSSQVFKGRVYFDSLIEVESIGINPFSTGGDSGALVVSDQGKVEKIVGILIGGNSHKSYVLPLKAVLNRHNMRLLGGHNI